MISGILSKIKKSFVTGLLLILPLIKLSDMKEKYPRVAAKLNNGLWTKEAEQELLGSAS